MSEIRRQPDVVVVGAGPSVRSRRDPHVLSKAGMPNQDRKALVVVVGAGPIGAVAARSAHSRGDRHA